MKKVIIPIAILALIIFVACNNDAEVAPIEETTVEEVIAPPVEVIKEEKEAPMKEVPETNNNTKQ